MAGEIRKEEEMLENGKFLIILTFINILFLVHVY